MKARPWAYLGGMLATDLAETRDLTADASPLDGGGWWALVATFEGRMTGYRFDTVRRVPLPEPTAPWRGPDPAGWLSSMDEQQYRGRVDRIREYIAAGDVYQVNLCRTLSAPIEPSDPAALAKILADGNPAPFQGVIHNGENWIVSASPELFLRRRGAQVWSSPIKGTAPTADGFRSKDFPENIMITDLVRNDLNRVCTPESVRVTELLAAQQHPGLAHLVSTVTGELRRGVGWPELLAATFPPGSVTGAPKIRALEVIAELEPVARGPYCGGIGFVDADNLTAVLAVGIRTFYTEQQGRVLTFGTGAGITYPSDPGHEWQETELKARRLIGLASGPADDLPVPGGPIAALLP